MIELPGKWRTPSDEVPEFPRRALTDDEGKVVYRPAYELMTKHELIERIEKATAMLTYFGPQGANIIAVLEGNDGTADL